jgi:hypothetical protein
VSRTVIESLNAAKLAPSILAAGCKEDHNCFGELANI